MYLIILMISVFSMSSANTCCKSVNITATKLSTKNNQANKLTMYTKHNEMNGKPSYLSDDNTFILFYSKNLMESSCTLTGAWSVADLSCRPQVAAVVGKGWNETLEMAQQILQMYPSTGSRSHISGLPILAGKGACH